MKKINRLKKNIPDTIKAMNKTYDDMAITSLENHIACMYASPIMFAGMLINYVVGHLYYKLDPVPVLINSLVFFCLGVLFELALRIKLKYCDWFVSVLYSLWFLFFLLRLYSIIGPSVWTVACIHMVFALSRIKRTMTYIIGTVILLSVLYLIFDTERFRYTIDNVSIIVQLVLFILFVWMLVIINKISTSRYNQLLFNYKLVMDQKEDITMLYEEMSATEEELRNQNEQLTTLMNELKTGEDLLLDLAYNDVLTRLPNRISFLEQLNGLIDSNETKRIYIVFIDIDSFKKINDTLGHNIGDNYLIYVAEMLKETINKEDFLARIGGDEFAIIITRNISRRELLHEMSALKEAFLKPFTINNLEIRLSASFGIAVYPDDDTTSAGLMKCADMSMYHAKESGKNNVQFYNSSMLDRMLYKTRVESLLVNAIQKGEFYLEYQPQFSIYDSKIRGIEVLTRWISPEFGFVSPLEFIPIAEETGLINILGEWILRTACQKLRFFQKEYNFDAIMCVNISTIQIVNERFIDIVKNILKETDTDPEYIELEITESVVIESIQKATRILMELKRLGLRIALDDFGMGYSSLNYLKSLPIDTLKVDKSFIDNLSKANVKKQIVGDIIQLGHTLGLTIVAEGVESKRQLQCLKRYSCDYFQGFLYARPLKEEALIELLKKYK